MVTRVSDVNPRRFIQIMNALVEKAMRQKLTRKNQHRVLTEYCALLERESEGLPEYGLVLKQLIGIIGNALGTRIHGPTMTDGGCGFRVTKELLDDPAFAGALQLGVDFRHMVIDEKSEISGIDERSDLRLSYICGKLLVAYEKGFLHYDFRQYAPADGNARL